MLVTHEYEIDLILTIHKQVKVQDVENHSMRVNTQNQFVVHLIRETRGNKSSHESRYKSESKYKSESRYKSESWYKSKSKSNYKSKYKSESRYKSKSKSESREKKSEKLLKP